MISGVTAGFSSHSLGGAFSSEASRGTAEEETGLLGSGAYNAYQWDTE